ncbi:DUF2334 domain-containing protein [Bacillus sp. NPDC093026]|uniref:DUF2334 domain-containing protein n=1 Tax=Bacillus sp. NPDC093026 TaxID=3363948 RepID=UPI00381F9406
MNFNSFMKSCLLIVFLLVWTFKHIESAEALGSKPDTLVVYTTETGEMTPDVHMLDLLAGYFPKQTTVLSDDQMSEKVVKGFQQVIYIGEIKKTLPKQTVNALNKSKRLIAIGYNAEQLNPFSKLTFHKQDHVNQIRHTHEKTYRQLDRSITALTVKGKGQQSEFILKKNQQDHPFVIQSKKGSAYIGILHVLQNNKLLAEVFQSLMQPSNQTTTKYLRLGDISPVTDEKKLLELGQYLSDQHIPFLLAVTPAWIDPATGDEVTLKDRPHLVNVLKQLQSKGGSVILHGFSRTYRTHESGQGFEFWDAQFDQPITSNEPKKVRSKQLSKSDFPSEKDYDAYIKTIQNKEEIYTKEKLTEGIELLVKQGLYPLAFEVPHDAISQHGYQVISQYFSSLFGQVQLSDKTWRTSGAPPYTTTPAMLHGMTLYPEQPWDAKTGNADTVYQAEQILSMQHIQSPTIGLSYQADAGIAKLTDLITHMEAIPSSEWLNLKKTKQSVQTQNVQIKASGNGHIQVHQSNIAETKTVKRSGMENMLRILIVIVLLFIVTFMFYTLYLRLTMKKRIFKERKSGG